MRRVAFAGILLATAVVASHAEGGSETTSAEAAELETDEEKTLYALGLMMGGNLGSLHLSPAETTFVLKGIRDAASGEKPQVEIKDYMAKVQELSKSRRLKGAEIEKAKSAAYLEKAAKEAGAVKTESGLVFKRLKEGTGSSPSATDSVKVHYEGTLTDGTVFDSSVKRNQPAEFALNRVIPCWTEGLQRMKVGEKAKLVCPSSIAYGDAGRPPTIPGGATLTFEVELLEVKK